MQIIFGIHTVIAYLKQNVTTINKVYINQSRQDKRITLIKEYCSSNRIEMVLVTVDKLNFLAKNSNHQGVVAEVLGTSLGVESLDELLNSIKFKSQSIILILDGITDPYNLGAIIRTAECFGVDGVILPKDNSANIHNSLVAKASCGAVNFISVISVTNINRSMDKLKQFGYWLVGSSVSIGATSLFDFKFSAKMVIVMGSEEKGIRRLVRENCDYLITIPMLGKTSSLNVSVATGIVLASATSVR